MIELHLGSAMTAVLVVYALDRHPWREWAWIAGIGGAVAWAVPRFGRDPIHGWSLGILAWCAVAPFFPRSTTRLASFLPVALIPLIASGLSTISSGPTIDAALARADARLGDFAAWRARVCDSWICCRAYEALSLALLIAWRMLDRRGRGAWFAALAIGIGVLGGICYHLWPAEGPQYAGAPDGVPRNCMPSLHTAWCLLIIAGAARLGRWWLAGAVAYAVPMLACTLTQHYLVDMLAAVPFFALVWGAVWAAERAWKYTSMARCAASGSVAAEATMS